MAALCLGSVFPGSLLDTDGDDEEGWGIPQAALVTQVSASRWNFSELPLNLKKAVSLELVFL